jgi:hypothetical protein
MEFEGLVYEKGDLRICLDYIGEGKSGFYDPDDDTDEPLLRVYVDLKDDAGDWKNPQDCSACIPLSVKTPKDLLNKIIKRLYDEMAEAVRLKLHLSHVVGRWTHVNWKNLA